MGIGTDIYSEIFGLYGCSKIDFSELNGSLYDNVCAGSYFTTYSVTPNTSKSLYSLEYGYDGNTSVIYSIINLGDNSHVFLKSEGENASIEYSKSLVIPLKNRKDKKYIKIESSSNDFYWSYEFSTTNNDTRYLGSPRSSLGSHELGNTTYIYNPFVFATPNNNLNWFIIINHYNSNSSSFRYKYLVDINEKDEDNGKEDNNIFQKSFFWIILIASIIVIIAIILIGICCYKKYKEKSFSESIEQLINNAKGNEMNIA